MLLILLTQGNFLPVQCRVMPWEISLLLLARKALAVRNTAEHRR
jgi:hypothetical protein